MALDVWGAFPWGMPPCPCFECQRQAQQAVALANYQAADAQQGSWWPELNYAIQQYQPAFTPPPGWITYWYQFAKELEP